MPVAVVRKIEALRHDFETSARLADLLGVNRSQVTRWLRGAGIDPLNAEKVDFDRVGVGHHTTDDVAR